MGEDSEVREEKESSQKRLKGKSTVLVSDENKVLAKELLPNQSYDEIFHIGLKVMEKAESSKGKMSFAEFFDELLAEREYAYGKVASLFIEGSPFEKVKYAVTKFLELVELNPNILNHPYRPQDYGYPDCIYLHTKFIHGKFIGWKCGNRDSPYETDKAHFEVTYNDGKTTIKAKGMSKLVEPEECLKCQSISRLIELESRVVGRKAKKRRKKRAVLIANYDEDGRPIPATQKAVFDKMREKLRGSDAFFKKVLRNVWYSQAREKWLAYDDTEDFNYKKWETLCEELGRSRGNVNKIIKVYLEIDPMKIIWHKIHGHSVVKIGNMIGFSKN